MKKKQPKKQALAKPHKAIRTSVSTRNTAFGLPIPTAAQHTTAVKAMAPYLDEFQRAADEQTRQDFGPGILDKVTKVITPERLRKRLAEKRDPPKKLTEKRR